MRTFSAARSGFSTSSPNTNVVPGDSPLSATLLDQIVQADGWNLEHRIKSLITNLHAPESDRVVGTLSGGEKRRVALCRALLARPDFLILDEPTNHLDTGSIEWLEDFLARYAGTCLFVTHDRYFLDRVATRIVELSRGQFISYDGNYTDYLLARAQRQAVEEAQEHQRQKFLKRELQWVRKAPRARRTKSVDRVERYFEMAAQEAPEAELDVELIIPTPPKLANRIIELRDVSVELGGRTLFQHVNLNLAAGERLGVVGRNGLGKSSLLKVILQELPAASGAVEIGARTQINYVDQNRLLLDDAKTVWEEVGSGGEHVTLGEQSITLRAYLRRFLFSEDRINTKISQLSGGERSRVLLAKILKRGGNVLMLDEPTNDLDLGTLRLLEEALVAFGGCVIVVSHDRYFLNRVCTSILAFEGEGRVAYSVGNYDYYLEKRGAPGPVRDSYPAPAEAGAEQRKSKDKPRKLKWKEEREWESMEANILVCGKRSVGFGGHVCRAGFLCETALGDFRVGDAIENGTRQSRAPLRAVARTRAPAERPGFLNDRLSKIWDACGNRRRFSTSPMLEFGREMTASKIIEEIKRLEPKEQLDVIRFAYQLDAERRLTGKELSSLAECMVNATDPAEEARIRESIGRGFYGQRENA